MNDAIVWPRRERRPWRDGGEGARLPANREAMKALQINIMMTLSAVVNDNLAAAFLIAIYVSKFMPVPLCGGQRTCAGWRQSQLKLLYFYAKKEKPIALSREGRKAYG